VAAIDEPDELARTLQRRLDAAATLGALSPATLRCLWRLRPDAASEVAASVAEVAGLARMMARTAGVPPLAPPPRVVASNGGRRRA
jgi:hypothetical protein